MDVYAVEYPYLGPNQEEFRKNEHSFYVDAQIAFDYIEQNLQITSKDIIIYGRSLGTGPACYLARKK